MIKNPISTKVFVILFLLSSALTSVALANGTVSSAAPVTKSEKQPAVTHPDFQDTYCPIACPCPDSWLGGALDPCYTPSPTEPCENPCCFNSGFYLGAHIGYLYARHKYNVTLRGVTSGTFNKTKNQNTLLGGVLLGGRYFIYRRLFLGAEITANMDGSSTQFTVIGNFGDSYLHKLRRQFNFFPSAIIGTTFCELFATYLKLGADISRYRAVIFTSDVLSFSTFKTHKTRTVFLPAIGIEYCFSPTLSLRLEASHNFSPEKVSMAVTTNSGNGDRLTVKAHNTALTAGFIYKF